MWYVIVGSADPKTARGIRHPLARRRDAGAERLALIQCLLDALGPARHPVGEKHRVPGLVNIQKAMENHHFLDKSTVNHHFQ